MTLTFKHQFTTTEELINGHEACLWQADRAKAKGHKGHEKIFRKLAREYKKVLATRK